MAISLISTMLIFSFLEIFFIKAQAVYINYKNSKNVINTRKEEVRPKQYKIDNNGITYENVWQIEIPKIELVAPIAEGTSQEIMKEFVGHFENTEFLNGNIGLAAHNRGYPINYFARIKELEINDEIIYKTRYGTKKYRVILTTIIQDTDWSYLQKTEENKITLITCVENQPTNRRCVQGIEIKEE